MIKNTTQENLTKDKITELTELRDKANQDIGLSQLEKLYTLNSFDGMIGNLQEQLEEYEQLKLGNLKILDAETLDQLPKMLIKARIAQDMSQTELAKKLDIQVQQIQRYEANDYQSISFDRLVEIAKQVGICVRFEPTIIIGTGPKFQIPDHISEASITQAEQMVKENCSIFI